MTEDKYYLHSRTLWANVLMIIAFLLQAKYGYVVLTPQDQGALLGAVNIGLRVITNQPLSKENP